VLRGRAGHGRPPPWGHWNAVPADWVRQRLRRAFALWGLPGVLRVDNGLPWGPGDDLPTALALWVIGLGVGMIWNPPRRPQANGVVERSQRTGQCWAEPWACATPAELQRRLDEMDRIQRAEYPSLAGRSRLATFPALAHSGRRYSEARERRGWDLGRAREHLAGYQAERRVDGQGRVSIYDRPRYVGVRYRGQRVWVHYDPEGQDWVVADEDGRYLCRAAAPEISRGRILGLAISGR
jgi:hypothetical protein